MPQKLNFDDAAAVAAALPRRIKQKKLSILLPAHNEEAFIGQNIAFIAKLLRSWGWNFEIIASNDGSRDGTLEAITALQGDIPELAAVTSPRNFGKGRALATAYEASSGEYILFLDADLELPAEHIPYFFRQMLADKGDIVIGSKKHPLSDVDYPSSRRLFSTVYFFGVKLLFGLPVQDTQTGIKLFKREVLEASLPYLLVKRFAFDIELLTLCHSHGAKISSHPVVVRYIRDGIGRMGLNTILHMVKDTAAVFWRLRTGFWRHLPPGKTPLKIAAVSLGQGGVAQAGDVFAIKTIDDLPALLPRLKGFDVVLFLKEGEELASFMGHTLERLFSDPLVEAAVPLLYNKHEEGPSAKRYYTLANALYEGSFYARFRPRRPRRLGQAFALGDCALRLSALRALLASDTPPAEIKVQKPHYSPYFFIHTECSPADWQRIHGEGAPSRPDSLPRIAAVLSTAVLLFGAYPASALLFPALILAWAYLAFVRLGGEPLIWFASLSRSLMILGFASAGFWLGGFSASAGLLPLPLGLWLALEGFLFFWYNFSLGLRRGLPFYLFFCKSRLLLLLPKRNL